MRLWQEIGVILRSGQSCILVSVVETLGSSPREAGARLLVSEGEGSRGTIGGGMLEGEAIRRAQSLLGGESYSDLQFFALGPDMGQCCGGTVRLLFEKFDISRLPEIVSLEQAERQGRFYCRSRIPHDGGLLRREILQPESAGAAHGFRVQGEEMWEAFAADRGTVALFGAGHVGKALARALAPLDFQVRLIDSRREMFDGGLPGNVSPVHSADPVGELKRLPQDSLVLIMTHSHALDLDIVARALELKGPAFIGLIGSKTKRARFVSRLRAAGLSDGQIGRLTCPIGLDGIGCKEPAAIAVSVVAQLLQLTELLAENKPGTDEFQAENEKQGMRYMAMGEGNSW